MKGFWGTWLRLGVGLGALAFLIARVDMGRAAETLRTADPAWIGLALAVQGLSKTCWVRRWGTLLGVTGTHPGAATLLRLILVGLFFNNFLPSSIGGDVVRGIGLARTGVPRAAAAATVLADRLIGLFTLGIMAALGGLLGAIFWPADGPWVAAAVFALGVVAAIPLVTRPEVLDRIARSRLIPLFGRVAGRIRKLIDRISFLSGRRRAVTRAVALSLGLSACSAVYHWSVGRAIGLPVPLAAFFVIVPTVMLFAALPITLNGLGVRELGFVGLLGAQGVPPSTAAVFAFLAFAGTFGFAIAGGILFLVGGRHADPRDGGAA
jgi:uncharacterized protein (TIRG00374 family)